MYPWQHVKAFPEVSSKSRCYLIFPETWDEQISWDLATCGQWSITSNQVHVQIVTHRPQNLAMLSCCHAVMWLDCHYHQCSQGPWWEDCCLDTVIDNDHGKVVQDICCSACCCQPGGHQRPAAVSAAAEIKWSETQWIFFQFSGGPVRPGQAGWQP